MPNSLALLYLSLGALIAAVEVHRLRARQPFDALTLFNGAYFLFFVFHPLNVLVLGEAAVRQKYAYQTWSHGDHWTALLLILSYVLFVYGYYRRARHATCLVADTGGGGQANRAARWLIAGFLGIGGLALGYHVSLAGGVTEAIAFAPKIRTGEHPLEGNALFVRQFASFLATAFMLVWAVYIDTHQKNTQAPSRVAPAWQGGLLLIAGLAFVYFALTTYGRREFFYPMFVCLVIWLLAGRHRLWGGLGWLLVLAILWFGVRSLTILEAVQSATVQSATFFYDGYFGIVQGLGDSFMHFVAARHAELWQFGFLADIWEIPLQLLPSQVLGFERPRGMLGETSTFILGKPLGHGLTGEEPLGLHGYLLVNFSWAGMLLIFYLAGIGYRALDAALRPPKGGSALGWLMFLWATIGALEFLREGVLVLVLKPRISWWLALGILLWFGYRHAVRRASPI